jgi:hypothetical protein
VNPGKLPNGYTLSSKYLLPYRLFSIVTCWVCQEMTVVIIDEQKRRFFTLLHIPRYFLCLYGTIETFYYLFDICHNLFFFFFFEGGGGERERERECVISYFILIDHIP